MQLGLQHTDADILRMINRGCTAVDAAVALRRLKDACFKVDLMPSPPRPNPNPSPNPNPNPTPYLSQAANEVASCKIIGITLETRPDCIDAEELRRLRRCAQGLGRGFGIGLGSPSPTP